MVSEKQKEEWIVAMCKDHPKIPKCIVENLASVYAADDGEWIKNKEKHDKRLEKKGAKKANKKKIIEKDTENANKYKVSGAISVERGDVDEKAFENFKVR
jgi:hypothetical protein